MKQFDVLVVGAGHAGVEAALAAARIGRRVAIVTMSEADLGKLSCNPAVGGVGKGHLVREIDALGGAMALLADRAAIQHRLLNRGRGPAVQGPRVQCDRDLYAAASRDMLAAHPEVALIKGQATALIVQRSAVQGVELADGSSIAARTVVLATGTFLGARIFCGKEVREAGRVGDGSAVRLAAALVDAGCRTGLLKTGTPARLRMDSIDWDRVGRQDGDDDPTFMSFDTASLANPQIACGITHSNARTHDIIRDNLAQSAVYGGAIEGQGPRYCPSIEDKIVRFADRDAHQIFLEPEGLNSPLCYPNGISTSLPADVQEEFIRTIPGLEAAVIAQPGYAVEYRYVDPTSLTQGLMHRELDGLFLAGQINGTTGYEEAAAQGLVAGLNAARHAQGDAPVEFPRENSYIGVMIDDLTSRGVTEPYRMFTSRSEFRLSLRADNAEQRLTPLGRDVSIVTDAKWSAFLARSDAYDAARRNLEATRPAPADLVARQVPVAAGGRPTAWEALSQTPHGAAAVAATVPAYAALPGALRARLEAEAIYAPYIERQTREIDLLRKEADTRLPDDLDFGTIQGLSHELRGKLARHRPRDLRAASRIEGMTPAAILLLGLAARSADVRRG